MSELRSSCRLLPVALPPRVIRKDLERFLFWLNEVDGRDDVAPDVETVVDAYIGHTDPLTGAELIAAERRRQVEEEGYDADHDDGHDDGEILSVASDIVGYLDPGLTMDPEDTWGLIAKHSRREGGDLRLLVIAGALIAAEIDRLQRPLR